MAHAIFAPSSSATWIPCAFSARNSVPEQDKPLKTQLAAAEGTRVHALLEVAISEMEFPEDGDTAADAIELGIDFLRQLEPGRLSVEDRVDISPECWGRTDVHNYNPYIYTVFDLKNGKWDVDAFHNKQMLTYSAAIMLRLLQRGLHVPDWWRLVIFQPNGLDEEPFKQWVAHRTDVETHLQKIFASINDRNPQPRPGTHCRWCKAFQQCPAMVEDAAFLMAAITRPITELTTDELTRLVRLIRALNDVKSVYDDALTTHLRMGRTSSLGATLKMGRTFRSWNDATQAALHLYQQFGERGVKPISPAQAEKLGPAGKLYASVGAHKPPGEMKASY